MGNTCCGNQPKADENHEIINAPQSMEVNESRLHLTEYEDSVMVMKSPSPKNVKHNKHEHSESFELTRETKAGDDY